jgi:hypothetical protein
MELSHLKTAFAFIAFIGVVTIAFAIATGTHEAVPDRAQFLVNTNEGYVVPCPIAGRFIFHPLPDHPANNDVLARFKDAVSWGELKQKDHPYHD